MRTSSHGDHIPSLSTRTHPGEPGPVTRTRLATAVARPAESDPVTLAKTIATLDHLSGGRVTLGAGFGWNTDELALIIGI